MLRREPIEVGQIESGVLKRSAAVCNMVGRRRCTSRGRERSVNTMRRSPIQRRRQVA
jgi:hypothetical protein